MRLVSLELSGFRGFSGDQRFDLDADAVVVVGANGQGKTSLFDAILWAVAGRVPRLKCKDADLISLYSNTGQARVELCLRDERSEYTIVRSCDGLESRVTVRSADSLLEGQSAESHLISLVWPDAGTAADSRDALASVLTRSVYLQQDLVKAFVDATTDQERFAAVSELFGSGRVTELLASLETAKRAWTTVTNRATADLETLRTRLTSLEARSTWDSDVEVAAGLVGGDQAWLRWHRSLAVVGINAPDVNPENPQVATVIDATIKELEAIRLMTARRAETLRTMQASAEELQAWPSSDAESAREQAAAARAQVEQLRVKVRDEQERLVEFRRIRTTLRERTAQLKALADLALQHLDELCPVCSQPYDINATRVRLQRLASEGEPRESVAPEEHVLIRLLAALATAEREAAAKEAVLHAAEQARIQRTAREELLVKRAEELGIAADRGISKEVVIAESSATAERGLQLIEAQRSGEALALRLARASAASGGAERRRQIDLLKRDISRREEELAGRSATGNLAQRIIEALRQATSGVVEDRLREIKPLLQGIYSRIDPHPSFRAVAFLARVVRGRRELVPVISDLGEQKDCEDPAIVLSSSQMNALAVCAFLALNLGAPRPPMAVTILDDPLQSLDDINLLGLVDLLRRTKNLSQLFVSTHDARFGELLARKLRPIGGEGRTIVIEIEGWARRGPRVATRQIPSDPALLRLVAS